MDFIDFSTISANIATLIGVPGIFYSGYKILQNKKNDNQKLAYQRLVQWQKDFASDKPLLYSSLDSLKNILNDIDKISLADSKEFNINYERLFVNIQTVLSNSNSEDNLEFIDWIDVNNLILKHIKDQKRIVEELITKYDMTTLFSIDFSDTQILEKILELDTDYKFFGCKFPTNELLSLEKSENELKLFSCYLDRKIELEESKKIEETGVLFNDNTYVISGENSTYEKVILESDEQGVIFENRDMPSRPIDRYVFKQKIFEITIEDNKKLSVNNRIQNELCKEILKRGAKINISRSKNFIPNMKSEDQKKWKWHSWNVLPATRVEERSDFEYFVFAINFGNENTYQCIVIEKDKMQELVEQKKPSKDNRFFFYFATPNN